jgi:glyoxylase-like metal-dependent hydrolase (beta-lactamase superfamily II)
MGAGRNKLMLRALASLIVLGCAPVFAQVDLSGEWGSRYTWDYLERLPGPELGDYLGLPINNAARLKANSWEASTQTIPERQCIPHGADYLFSRAGFPMRIWAEEDPVTEKIVAFRIRSYAWSVERTIWMDGRPHPSQFARHTWQGFSTGQWNGNVLTVTTTHLKWNYIRRNGVPRSDEATVTEHFARHGDYLTLLTYIDDPVYLTEPLLRTSGYVLDPQQQLEPFPCEPVEEVVRPEGAVPHHLPGTNKDIAEFPAKHGLPAATAMGGAETMYPGYKIPPMPLRPTSALHMYTDAIGVEILPVQKNIYMLAGDGANITLQVGKDGVLVVDTGFEPISEMALAAIRKLTDKPIHYVLNTAADADHTGGNEAFAKAGNTIMGGDVADDIKGLEKGAAIIAHRRVLDRMTDAKAAFGALPTDIYGGKQKDLYFNEEPVVVLRQPAAHTDGDSLVFFRGSDVISTGDIFITTGYPVIDLDRGGSIQGLIDALNRLIDLTVPAALQEGGTLVIPGHGRISDEGDVVEYRDMVTIIRDRIADMIKRGLALEQVKAAKPTEDYDPRYGSADKFIEAVYRSLHK